MRYRWLNSLTLLGTLLCGACQWARQEPFEEAPLSPGQIQVTHLSERRNLAIERIRFWSNEMKQPRFFLALVPKTPTPPSEVFILNHGWFDRPEYLLQYLKVDQVYDEMLTRGTLRPAIVILPDVRFSGFYRIFSKRFPFPNYLTLVAEEVAGTVSKHYGIPFDRNRWAMGGFSFGGYLSLDVGRRYPGRFASVSVVSAFFDQRWSFWPSPPLPSASVDSHGRGLHTIVVPGPIPRLFLACGSDDRMFGQMTALHNKFAKMGIPHVWWTAPGGHTWETWFMVLPLMLKFHLGKDNTQNKAG